MDKLSRTARLLDKIIAIIYWIMVISAVLVILSIAILAFLSINSPELWTGFSAGLSIYSLIGVPLYCVMLLTIRDTLKPFINRQPFHETVARNLRRLAILMTANTVLEWIGSFLMTRMAQDLFNPASLDLTPLLYAGGLYLLSKVFLYGQELQQLSDETL